MKTVMNIAENNPSTVANAMQNAQAEQYVKPAIEVIEMQMEGVLCDSSEGEGVSADSWGNGGQF